MRQLWLFRRYRFPQEEEKMAREDVCDFLTELGLNVEQCDLICGLLQKKAPFFLITEGFSSFNINVIIAERVKALYGINKKEK